MNFNIFGKSFYANKWVIAVLAIIIVGLLGTAGYYLKNNGDEVTIERNNLEPSTVKDVEPKKDIGQNELPEIKVHVDGCVKNPGVVTLKKGQIIDDAIKAAGGVTEEADLESVNLAYKLTDNVKITIKSKKQKQVEAKKSEASNDSGQKSEPVNGVTKDSGGAVVEEKVDAASPKGGKVNINKASLEELTTIGGVGPATAKDIIDYREKNGPFKTIEDVMKVQGIKEGKFSKMKDYITVE